MLLRWGDRRLWRLVGPVRRIVSIWECEMGWSGKRYAEWWTFILVALNFLISLVLESYFLSPKECGWQVGVWDLRFSQWQKENLWFSALSHHVAWWLDTISEDHAPPYSAKMVAAWSFGMLVSNHHDTWQNNQENHEF